VFHVQGSGTERQLSRAALINEVRAGKAANEAMVSSVEFFGDGDWRRLDETSLWRICQAGLGSGSALVPGNRGDGVDAVGEAANGTEPVRLTRHCG